MGWSPRLGGRGWQATSERTCNSPTRGLAQSTSGVKTRPPRSSTSAGVAGIQSSTIASECVFAPVRREVLVAGDPTGGNQAPLVLDAAQMPELRETRALNCLPGRAARWVVCAEQINAHAPLEAVGNARTKFKPSCSDGVALWQSRSESCRHRARSVPQAATAGSSGRRLGSRVLAVGRSVHLSQPLATTAICSAALLLFVVSIPGVAAQGQAAKAIFGFARIMGIMVGTFVGVALLCCLVHYGARGGIRGCWERYALHRVAPAEVQQYRKAHHMEERVTEPTRAELVADVTIAAHGEEFTPHHAHRRGSAVSVVSERHLVGFGGRHSAGLHHVRIHMPQVDRDPVCVQASRPLAQAHVQIGTHVYYEASINFVGSGVKLAIGWGTSPMPSHIPLGETPHAVALVSCTNSVLDARGPHAGAAGRVKDVLRFKSSDDRSAGYALNHRALRDGDVVGAGYVQHQIDGRHKKQPRLMIQFYFTVNGEMLVVPHDECSWFAVNSKWDSNKANAAYHRPEVVSAGLLSNGVAYPSVSSSGPLKADLRFEEPFEHFEEIVGDLCSIQGKTVGKDKTRRVALEYASRAKVGAAISLAPGESARHRKGRSAAQLVQTAASGVTAEDFTNFSERTQKAVVVPMSRAAPIVTEIRPHRYANDGHSSDDSSASSSASSTHDGEAGKSKRNKLTKRQELIRKKKAALKARLAAEALAGPGGRGRRRSFAVQAAKAAKAAKSAAEADAEPKRKARTIDISELDEEAGLRRVATAEVASMFGKQALPPISMSAMLPKEEKRRRKTSKLKRAVEKTRRTSRAQKQAKKTKGRRMSLAESSRLAQEELGFDARWHNPTLDRHDVGKARVNASGRRRSMV